MYFGSSVTDCVGCLFSVAGENISVSENDDWSRDVLQKEPAVGITAGQLEREAIQSAQASYARIGNLHGRITKITLLHDLTGVGGI